MRRLAPLLALLALAPSPPDDPSRAAYEADPKGWTDLVARGGKLLDNWTRGPIPPTGRLNPQSQWSVEEATGYLLCEGDKGHEWLRFDKEYGDFILHVEWRFTPVTSGKSAYNSGVYVRNSEDASTWHQAQAGGANSGFLFGVSPDKDGKPARFDLSKQLTDRRVKPAGDWNTFEVTCKGRDVTLWTNGVVTSAWHDCVRPRGYVGLEAEGYRIEFRNVLVKEL